MSAQDNLNEQQFFHGSLSNALKKGDMVDLSHSADGFTYFTRSLHEAGSYTMPEIGDDSRQGSVYRVQPSGTYRRDPRSGGYKSRSSLKVLGEV